MHRPNLYPHWILIDIHVYSGILCIYSKDIFSWAVCSSYPIRPQDLSAYDLLILLNKLGKRDKMGGLPSILSLFRNKFNKFNNTRA